jgi:hypothetical protein
MAKLGSSCIPTDRRVFYSIWSASLGWLHNDGWYLRQNYVTDASYVALLF